MAGLPVLNQPAVLTSAGVFPPASPIIGGPGIGGPLVPPINVIPVAPPPPGVVTPPVCDPTTDPECDGDDPGTVDLPEADVLLTWSLSIAILIGAYPLLRRRRREIPALKNPVRS